MPSAAESWLRLAGPSGKRAARGWQITHIRGIARARFAAGWQPLATWLAERSIEALERPPDGWGWDAE
eukprot:13199577-Alexandrium_andersonii.AAC.1